MRTAVIRVKCWPSFWSDSSLSAARLNLRAELSVLRKQLEPAPEQRGKVLLADNTSVQFAANAIYTDVQAFELAIQATSCGTLEERLICLQQAVECYRGGLLPGYYDEWLLPEQERLADQYLNALRQMVALLCRRGDHAQALEVAHRAVAANPLCEPAYGDLIALYLEMGRIAEALLHYRQLEARLRETLDVAPSLDLPRLLKSRLPIVASTAIHLPLFLLVSRHKCATENSQPKQCGLS